MRTIYLITLALAFVLAACKKEEKEEPTPTPEPVMREVRYEVLCAGSYLFTFRVNGVGNTAGHIGDTTNTIHISPGTWIQMGADFSNANAIGRIWLDDELWAEDLAPAGLPIYITDTIP